MSDFLDHKHCPICGRPIESETEDAYTHLYSPTRCEKVECEIMKENTGIEKKEIIHWCVHCTHLGMHSEDYGRRCIKCLRSALENEGVEVERPIYYGQ